MNPGAGNNRFTHIISYAVVQRLSISIGVSLLLKISRATGLNRGKRERESELKKHLFRMCLYYFKCIFVFDRYASIIPWILAGVSVCRLTGCVCLFHDTPFVVVLSLDICGQQRRSNYLR